MSRPDTVQWNCKQWLGDNKVLAMDWDARAMHFHLLMISTQETPPGTIPADDAAIRRWLSLPLGSVDADQTWRRVKSQLLAAWQPEGDRLGNSGMIATFERKERYSVRPQNQNGSKMVPEHIPKVVHNHVTDIEEVKEVDSELAPKNGKFSPPSLEQVRTYCIFRGKGVDPEKWINHYTANGWKVGRNSMKDWRAAVRTWESGEGVMWRNGDVPEKGACKRHPDSGLTVTGGCWQCYSERHDGVGAQESLGKAATR